MAFARNALKIVSLLGLMTWATGCGCSHEMAPRDVRVTLDDSLRDASGRLNSIQVDLVAVNATEMQRWTSIPVDQYWQPGNSLRATQDKMVMTFNGTENVNAKLLGRQDPLWAKWKAKNATDLVIIAFGASLAGSGEGQQDTRRIILPLDKCRWDSTGEIKILVGKSGVTSQTQPKPPEK